MRTVVLGPPPAELESLIHRRHALGLDRLDEVWEGEYHMAPGPGPPHALVDHDLAVLLDGPARAAGLSMMSAFNLGDPDDYRVPDHGCHRARPDALFVPTAAVVIEVLSPFDETYAKFSFYARRGVEEIVVADPEARTVQLYRSDGEGYRVVEASALLGVRADDLTAALPWP